MDEDVIGNEIKRNSMIASVVCLIFLIAYLLFEKKHFIVDETVSGVASLSVING